MRRRDEKGENPEDETVGKEKGATGGGVSVWDVCLEWREGMNL